MKTIDRYTVTPLYLLLKIKVNMFGYFMIKLI
jgi:hypothetical protein